MSFKENCDKFKSAVSANNIPAAKSLLQTLKGQMIVLDSLPPMNFDGPNAEEERYIAREVYEYAVLYANNSGDKNEFQRYISCLRPYYSSTVKSSNKPLISGLKLLYMLVENRLCDFHCEVELLSESELEHPNVKFCTELEQHMMVGAYDAVLSAATKPPVPQYSFFLSSLMETVRINIAECAQAAYKTLSISDAAKLLMFANNKDVLEFIDDNYPLWEVQEGSIRLIARDVVTKSEGIPNHKIINQVLTYASELERIV